MSGNTKLQADRLPLQPNTAMTNGDGVGYVLVPQSLPVCFDPATGQPVFFSSFPASSDHGLYSSNIEPTNLTGISPNSFTITTTNTSSTTPPPPPTNSTPPYSSNSCYKQVSSENSGKNNSSCKSEDNICNDNTSGNAGYNSTSCWDQDFWTLNPEDLLSVEDTVSSSDLESCSSRMSPEIPSTPGSSISSPYNNTMSTSPSYVQKPVNITPSPSTTQPFLLPNHYPSQNSSSSSVTLSCSETQTSNIKTEKGENLKLYLKNAKSKPASFASVFPSSLLCQPYKYDIKIIGPPYLMKQDLNLYLVYADSLAKPYTMKPSIKIMKEDTRGSEKIVRFQMTLCSFHFGKRQFRVAVEFSEPGADESAPVSLFFSTPFHTYARKKNTEPVPFSMSARPAKRTHDDMTDYQSPPSKKMRLDIKDSTSTKNISSPPSSNSSSHSSSSTNPGYLNDMNSNERTSAAIAIMDSLTPEERQAVHLYFGMHNGPSCL